MVYAVTQLVMWLSKPEFETPAVEEDDNQSTMAIDPQRPEASRKHTRASSISLGERLRRGMTGEMAADLQSLLNKTKPVIVKSNTVLGREVVDLTQVLCNLLHERIVAPAHA